MAKEYVIEINNNVVGLNQTDESYSSSTVQEQVPSAGRRANVGGISKAIAIQMAKQAANFAVNNIGTYTGDYISQKNIQGAIQVASLIGMAASGPIGATAALGSLTLQIISVNTETMKANRETELLRMRTGAMYYSGGRL